MSKIYPEKVVSDACANFVKKMNKFGFKETNVTFNGKENIIEISIKKSSEYPDGCNTVTNVLESSLESFSIRRGRW